MENCSYKVIQTSCCGRILYCQSCGKFHVEFNNLYFTFNSEEYQHFKKFILDLDAEHYARLNKNSICSKKVIIPFNHPNVMTMFSVNEINELKKLFGDVQTEKSKHNFEIFSIKNFSYTLN